MGGSSSEPNSRVVTHSCHNFGDQDWDHQLWNAISKGDVAKHFVGEIRWHGQQDTCMDVAGGRSDNGNKIQVWECTGSVNQQFMYNPDEPMPQIKWMVAQNKCLDV